ncbi:hypothetical protein CAPTEDRAFT_216663 [Capitella teleta]|uniref:Uncharacterized protein n=1 Tax=Capitella teleta TaxID=283909 RepID=R7THZ0_CAPTE|nr:hypothetical protein CAPTEDRAFT_216663 [Capitella teleta]|eukprot:ELT90710.1 hypothetical protein CAPTEDRAFT_216663 [Capitella teleta]
MDGHEKRVLRRMTADLVSKLRLTEGIAVQAYRQGLVDYKSLVDMLSLRGNTDRVLFFLHLIENVKPAGFEKFCFFLENHGNTRLCDDLWLELIAERGQLRIESEVIEEVRGQLRMKIKEGHLTEKDLEELIMIAATRCQVKREVKVKQSGSEVSGKSSSHLDSQNDKSIFEEVEKLCVEIERCMPGLLDNGELKGHLRQQGDADPAFQRLTEHKRSTALQRWMRDLKKKLNIPDDDRVNKNYGMPGLHMTHSFTSPVKSALSRSGTEASRELSSLSGVQSKKPTKGDQTTRVTNNKEILERNCVKFRTTKKNKRDGIKAKTINQKSDSNELIVPRKRTNASSMRQSKVSIATETTKNGRFSRGKKKTKKKGGKDDSDEELLYEMPEYRTLTPSEERQIQQEVVNLYKQRGIIENVRKAVGEQVSRKMAPRLSTMEQSYWTKRCDVMKRCQATGYYYFLSAHKRHRCHACKANDRPCTEDHCDHRSGRLSSSDWNLYSSFGSPDSRLKATEFDDCDCPGAITIPGQQRKRCIACAYANEQAPMLYDAAVTSDGSHHLTFPTLDSVTPKTLTQEAD